VTQTEDRAACAARPEVKPCTRESCVLRSCGLVECVITRSTVRPLADTSTWPASWEAAQAPKNPGGVSPRVGSSVLHPDHVELVVTDRCQAVAGEYAVQ